jgi:Ca-activated chloride channel family protein
MPSVGRFPHSALAILWASALWAQTDQESFRIIHTVELVVLDVSVRNHQGAYVTDLSKEAFAVWVDGKPQKVSQFSAVDAPVTIGLVVDNSGSMRFKRTEVVLAGMSFAKESNRLDEFFVVNFNNKVTLGLPPDLPFTDQLQAIRKALYLGDAAGQTALYDAIGVGVKHLELGHHEKSTLIVVSDGGDNVSVLRQRQIMNLVERTRATIYTIGLGDPEDRDLRPAMLKKFAKVSGGEYFQPAELNDVTDVLRKIAKDVRSRYCIAFTPSTVGGSRTSHRIQVTATSPDGSKLEVHTRTSYSSEPAPTTRAAAQSGEQR